MTRQKHVPFRPLCEKSSLPCKLLICAQETAAALITAAARRLAPMHGMHGHMAVVRNSVGMLASTCLAHAMMWGLKDLPIGLSKSKKLGFYERVSGARMHEIHLLPAGVAQKVPLGLCEDCRCVVGLEGMHAWDAASGEHILSTAGVTSEAVASCGPFILRRVETL